MTTTTARDFDRIGWDEAVSAIATRSVDLYDIEMADLRTTLRVLDLLTAGADGAVTDAPAAAFGSVAGARWAWARSEADTLSQAHSTVGRIIASIEGQR